MRALRESGLERDTLVMFISDNGMSFPFSKANCYMNSTRTPWIVYWPGVVEAGVIDDEHMISGIDFMPTILEACGIEKVKGMDGRSFLPILKGRKQDGRGRVFTTFHETSAKKRYEMRCLREKNWSYIFNAWSDGKTRFESESQAGASMKAMSEAAKKDKRLAERVNFFWYRTPEELYDLRNDPNELVNLAGLPEHKERQRKMRAEMLDWMTKTNDPILVSFKSKME